MFFFKMTNPKVDENVEKLSTSNNQNYIRERLRIMMVSDMGTENMNSLTNLTKETFFLLSYFYLFYIIFIFA